MSVDRNDQIIFQNKYNRLIIEVIAAGGGRERAYFAASGNFRRLSSVSPSAIVSTNLEKPKQQSGSIVHQSYPAGYSRCRLVNERGETLRISIPLWGKKPRDPIIKLHSR
jgi:hypothetical protein